MWSLFGRKANKAAIDAATPLAGVRYVVFDTELTGLDEKKDSIVSIGAVRMTGGAINLGDTFYRLASPAARMKPESVVVHEITPSEVVEKPAIDIVLSEFMRFCADDVLVGHFVAIDRAFLNREMKRVFGKTIANPVIDTFSVYDWLRGRFGDRECFTHGRQYKLYDIARCFGIGLNNAHNALMDAYTTAQLFQRMMPVLAEAGAGDIGDLFNIGMPFEGGDRFRQSGEIGIL